MQLLTWNIQWGRGVDGRVDLDRIAAEIRRLGDPDVICLQEVTAGFDDLADNDGGDQFARLAALFPGFAAISAPALDLAGPGGRRRLFGNMILSRLPVGPVQRIALPTPADPAYECMPRGLLVATVMSPSGPVRIMTTHLEWSNLPARTAQAEAIRAWHREACLRRLAPPRPGKAGYAAQPDTASALLTGDFNMRPEEATRARLTAPFAEPGVTRLLDAFDVAGSGGAHPPSMCLFDQADGPPRCLDYVFCTQDLAPRVQGVRYDQTSRASDHQPVLVELAEH